VPVDQVVRVFLRQPLPQHLRIARMRRHREAEVRRRHLDFAEAPPRVRRAEGAVVVLRPDDVGRGRAARQAMRILDALVELPLKRHEGSVKALAAQLPPASSERKRPPGKVPHQSVPPDASGAA